MAEDNAQDAPPPPAANAWGDALGSVLGDAPERIEYLWPDNLRAWQHWLAVQTQWRTGMGGATGMDYAGVRAYLQLQVHRKHQREVFDGIRACERATLDVWAEQRERDEQRRASEQSGPRLPR